MAKPKTIKVSGWFEELSQCRGARLRGGPPPLDDDWGRAVPQNIESCSDGVNEGIDPEQQGEGLCRQSEAGEQGCQ